MPFYEYISDGHSCQHCEETFVVRQSINSDALFCCPECGNPIRRLISLIGGIVVKNRTANQYSDIKQARFWRDKNGVKHRVTDADGHTGSATVTKKDVTDAMVRARKRRDAKRDKKRRLKLQENLAIERIKRGR